MPKTHPTKTGKNNKKDHRLIEKAASYLKALSIEIPSRRVGSPGNRAATYLFEEKVRSFGFETQSPEFNCIDWIQEGATLTSGRKRFEVFVSPYSLGCRVRAPLRIVSTDAELKRTKLEGAIVLLRGKIAREQLMPKNFPFYNPDRHRKIIRRLENGKPAAILTATSRDMVMVGSMYPFPLFEDGDFDIPSVFLTEEEGNQLLKYDGREMRLESRATRIPSKGCNIIARKGRRFDRRIVLFAHIDSRIGSPGANDNASGVVALLILSELLSDYSQNLGIEIVAMNGEDYFSNPGEQQYLALNEGKMKEIALGINLDDIGYRKGKIAYSLYQCPPKTTRTIRTVFSQYEDLIEGEPWYQGDHGLFLLNQRPAMALTSELVTELMANYTHTPKDSMEIVDPEKCVTVALSLRNLIDQLSKEKN